MIPYCRDVPHGDNAADDLSVLIRSVRAGFHSGGHVALTWNLHRWLTRSDTWQASITTWLEAGEQMTTELIGPPTSAYVDSTTCRVVKP